MPTIEESRYDEMLSDNTRYEMRGPYECDDWHGGLTIRGFYESTHVT